MNSKWRYVRRRQAAGAPAGLRLTPEEDEARRRRPLRVCWARFAWWRAEGVHIKKSPIVTLAVMLLPATVLQAQRPWQQIAVPSVSEAAASFKAPPHEYGGIQPFGSWNGPDAREKVVQISWGGWRDLFPQRCNAACKLHILNRRRSPRLPRFPVHLVRYCPTTILPQRSARSLQIRKQCLHLGFCRRQWITRWFRSQRVIQRSDSGGPFLR